MASVGTRKAVYFVTAPLLIVFCLWAFAWGAADAAFFRAKGWAEAWDNLSAQAAADGEVFRPSDADWAEAKATGRLAAMLSPWNPEYQETLAHIYAFKDNDLQAGDPAARESRLQALSYFQESAQLRPTWPYVYAEMALTKYQMGEMDAEFDRSLATAARLGPWEPDIMAVIANIGMSSWDKLSPATRELFYDTAVRSQQWGKSVQGITGVNVVWELARKRHKEFWLCGVLPSNRPHPVEYCNPAVAPIEVPVGELKVIQSD